MNRPPTEFQYDHTPAGYLITFRAHGTWLHGHDRGSVDRFHRTYGTPMLPPSLQRMNYERRMRKQQPVSLDRPMRETVESSIRETCAIRNWVLWAVNIRTNHVHTVISSNRKPELALSALKANATRSLREAGCWDSDRSPWTYGGSKKYLWDEANLFDAIDYVLYGQGEPLQNPER